MSLLEIPAIGALDLEELEEDAPAEVVMWLQSQKKKI